ncbi:MAG: YihY family inner membrane protein [Candidatus Aminicenantes bacterium]|nr:YihY family inner membrane protein [Candidatus Aminicenantes bacterium]
MAAPIFRLLVETFKRFNRDRCFQYSIIISYFALMCAVPLLALFAWVTTRFMGNSEIAVRSLNVFTEDFFAKFSPSFFSKMAGVANNLDQLGWIGLIGSLIAASLLFSNLIRIINEIFRTTYQRSFVYNRLMEYLIMFVIGVILFISLSITAVWAAVHRAIEASDFVQEYLNPDVIKLVDNIFIQYLIPIALSWFVLFVMYKFIPERKVHTRAAALAAVIAAAFWEIFKRLFVIWVVRFSAIGVVLSKVVQGTLTSIIFFLLWLSFSLVIMLWGAELAAVVNERLDERLKTKTVQAS